MRAALIYGAGDVRVEHVPDPVVQEPPDAVVRVLRTCICGSDLWPYRSMPASEQGRRIGHEFLGVVEDVARTSPRSRPVTWWWRRSCGRTTPATSAPRVCRPRAGTASVGPRTTVTVIGDGAVGLSAVLAAKRLGAERIILMGRHTDLTNLGREFGATDIVAERGEEGIQTVRELTGGDGTHTVLECVGLKPALETAFGIVRDGGVVSRVGAPQYTDVAMGFDLFTRNITVTGGVAPARAYIEDLLPDVLDGTVEPGRVFDRTVSLDEVPDGYRAMEDREALKVLVQP